MKAAVVRRPGLLAVESIPEPALAPYAVLCRNLYGATCTATDQHILHQTLPFPAPLPTVLGHETCGRVIDCGSSVRHLQPGDRITRTLLPYTLETHGLNVHWGGFAEYGLAYDVLAMREDGLPQTDIDRALKHQRIPEDMPDTVAPLLITWRETHSYITRMGLRKGMRVLVIGSGGNGLSFLCHAADAGAEVCCIGSAGREDHARHCGATAYFDYRDDAIAAKLRPYSGFDLIIDAIGSPLAPLVLPHLLPEGRLGVYGIEGGGGRIESPKLYEGDYLEGETHDEVIAAWRRGAYPVQAFMDVENPYPLDHIADAFQMLTTKAWPKALIRLHREAD